MLYYSPILLTLHYAIMTLSFRTWEEKMKLTINNTEMSFYISYGKRKKLSLEITPEGHMTVKVPKGTSDEIIRQFILQHTSTITNFYKRLEQRQYISRQKEYTPSENFLFMGKAYTFAELLKVPPSSEEDAKQLLQKFYTQQTKKIIKKRLPYFEKQIGVTAKSITVVDSPLSWGTCNHLKELTFNYKLSMAPLSVIDYVIIHELCHILHLNHDRSFWRRVGGFDPDFKKHQAYLQHFGSVMTI